MATPSPLNFLNFSGEGHFRSVTLALPSECVRNLLPDGLELGHQDATPKGTHPVILLFNDLFRGHLSVPSLLPNLTYREHLMGIPFSYISKGSLTPGRPGPYFFQPKLILDNIIPTLSGIFCWGFAKEMGSFQVTAERYCITSLTGQRITSLAWNPEAAGDFRPIGEFANFEPIRQMLNQPLISMVPASLGPFFVISDFDKNWDCATLRPFQTAVEVDVAYVPGYDCGRYPSTGWSPGIDQSVLGSYELRAPWRLGPPYSPMLSVRR